ncbi:MAG: cohesin domain-containing protein [Burkholderiales bacterium]|nr:cohesin domain-containing protein [Burkholderiales bacterium]
MLFLTLAGVVGLAVFAPAPDELAGPPQVGTSNGVDILSTERAAEQEGNHNGILSELPERATLGDTKIELFGLQSWQPPPPKIVVAPPPPPPPPPMLYRFAGRLLQDGKSQVFVSKGDAPVGINPGDTLDGGYVVESITNSAIELIYPPLKHKASIAIVPALSPEDSMPLANTSPPTLGTLSTSTIVNRSVLPSQPQQDLRASVAVVPKPNDGLARVQWEGPAKVKVGTNFSVALRMEADQPVSGSPMQIRFDPAILESIAVRPGKRYFAEAGRGFNYRINPDGSIFVGAASQSAAADPELLVLTFRPIKPNVQAEVRLMTLNLQGTTGRVVAHEAPRNFSASVMP